MTTSINQMKTHCNKALITATIALIACHGHALTLNELTKLFNLPAPDKKMTWKVASSTLGYRFNDPDLYHGYTQTKDGDLTAIFVNQDFLYRKLEERNGTDKIRTREDAKKAMEPLLARIRRPNEVWTLSNLNWNSTYMGNSVELAYHLDKINGVPTPPHVLYTRAVLQKGTGLPALVTLSYYTITPGKVSITKAQALKVAQQVRFTKNPHSKKEDRGGIIRSELTYAVDFRHHKTNSIHMATLTLSWTFWCAENGAVIYVDARDGKLIGKDEYK